MKQEILGTFDFGTERVQLVVREGTDGEFYMFPGDIDCARIKVGLDHDNFTDVMEALIHEAFEFMLERCGHRFRRYSAVSGDMANFMFMFDHREFAEVTARCAEFLESTTTATKKAWKKWHKNKRSK